MSQNHKRRLFCYKEGFSPLSNFKSYQQTVSRVLSRMVIYLGRMSPHASSRLLGRCRTSLASHSSVAPSGVYSARMSPYGRVSSYLAFPPLPAKGGRYLSVALSLESPPQAVSLHPVLWSPDFPHITAVPLCATIWFPEFFLAYNTVILITPSIFSISAATAGEQLPPISMMV